MDKATVIRDSREKSDQGYFWEESEWCDGYLVQKLDTGDYSIQGLEKELCIERKHSTAELAINVNEERFERELERMAGIKHAFIICEFSLSDVLNFPINSGIPNYRWAKLKVTPKYLLSCITKWQIKYGVKVLFCDDTNGGFEMVSSIMKRFYNARN